MRFAAVSYWRRAKQSLMERNQHKLATMHKLQSIEEEISNTEEHIYQGPTLLYADDADLDHSDAQTSILPNLTGMTRYSLDSTLCALILVFVPALGFAESARDTT